MLMSTNPLVENLLEKSYSLKYHPIDYFITKGKYMYNGES